MLRLATLRGLGGAETIVRDHLERALGSPRSGASRTSRRAIFDHLVTPSGSKIALRAADLADYAGVDAAESSGRCSRRSRASGSCARSRRAAGAGERYEIFHDVLADAVLAWRAERRLERERQVAARRHRRLLALAVAAIARSPP